MLMEWTLNIKENQIDKNNIFYKFLEGEDKVC